ncbi:hypothetical protein CMV_021401 [Castanea mollissima]|uniref:Uncharacterized protein n=1 Tax=Castanea mollissima TaxID=60419 RepID=A0A8J4VLP8_9ROSI|nr:hypothetical protein CMV_021401 [Castanea mollissima]
MLWLFFRLTYYSAMYFYANELENSSQPKMKHPKLEKGKKSQGDWKEFLGPHEALECKNDFDSSCTCARLDKALASASWIELFPSTVVEHVPSTARCIEFVNVCRPVEDIGRDFALIEDFLDKEETMWCQCSRMRDNMSRAYTRPTPFNQNSPNSVSSHPIYSLCGILEAIQLLVFPRLWLWCLKHQNAAAVTVKKPNSHWYYLVSLPPLSFCIQIDSLLMNFASNKSNHSLNGLEFK